jgi:hypothetical protein
VRGFNAGLGISSRWRRRPWPSRHQPQLGAAQIVTFSDADGLAELYAMLANNQVKQVATDAMLMIEPKPPRLSSERQGERPMIAPSQLAGRPTAWFA